MYFSLRSLNPRLAVCFVLLLCEVLCKAPVSTMDLRPHYLGFWTCVVQLLRCPGWHIPCGIRNLDLWCLKRPVGHLIATCAKSEQPTSNQIFL